MWTWIRSWFAWETARADFSGLYQVNRVTGRRRFVEANINSMAFHDEHWVRTGRWGLTTKQYLERFGPPFGEIVSREIPEVTNDG